MCRATPSQTLSRKGATKPGVYLYVEDVLYILYILGITIRREAEAY